MLEVRWFGHAMWRVSTENVAIVTDPFTDIGYPMPAGVTADVLLVSHDHFDHNNVGLVGGAPTVVREAGTFDAHGVEIDMIHVWHDEEQGGARGDNHIMRFDVGGRRFVHCGDLGHMPGADVIERLGAVDALMIPVGGHFTIDAETALELVGRIKPIIVFPMHYKTSALDFPIATVEHYARLVDNVRVVEDNHVSLTDADFLTPQTILMGFR